MGLSIQLLGRPTIERASGVGYQFRSRKTWALLTILILSERRLSRSELAALLFAEADDPLRALRWCMSELRRGLDSDGVIEGDPVSLELGSDVVVDVSLLMNGSWPDVIGLPGLGSDLLDGMAIQGGPAFSSWLLSEQRHVAATTEAVLHEAALGAMAHGDYEAAIGLAVRASGMNPFDENHQALLIRLYRLAGDDVGAERQFTAFDRVCREELGCRPGLPVAAAMRQQRQAGSGPTDAASVEAIVEAGAAAVAAGSVEAAVASLRVAVGLADATGEVGLRIRARLVLAEALIHSLRGFDEEGIAELTAAAEIALAEGDRASVALARAELGYVDFLRARYERAKIWLAQSVDFADDDPATMAKTTVYLGSIESDMANYPRAIQLIEESIIWARAAEDSRREAYGYSLLGRIHLLLSDLDTASHCLDISVKLAEGTHWLAFLPWPQALQGSVLLARGDVDAGSKRFAQAFARSCQLGDPCWEGVSQRGLAMTADARGESDEAVRLLIDARSRCNRLADPYVWLDAYILDALCDIGYRINHPDTEEWIDTLGELASRTGMKELSVRALLHGARIGRAGNAAAAELLAADIENPSIRALFAAHAEGRSTQSDF